MQVNGKIFAEALTKVLRASKKKSSLPILEDIHVTVEDGECTLMATDLETVVITTIPTIHSNATEGTFILPLRAHTMLQQLKDVPVINILAEPAGKVHVINVYHDLGRLKTIGENPANYPVIKPKETTVSLQQPTKDFFKLLNLAKKFVSDDDMRPAMTGVFMNTKYIVATDAHRLVEAKIETGMKSNLPFSAIIPVAFITAFAGIEDKTVTINFTAEQIIAQDTNTTIISRLIDARYPDYKVVVPKESLFHVTVNRKTFLSNLKLAMMCTDTETKITQFAFTNTGYKMTAYDKELIDEVVLNGSCEIIENNTRHQEFRIAFNGYFLQHQLEIIPDEEVTFEMNEGSKCALFHTETMTLLLMPVLFPTGEEVEKARAEREAAEKARTEAPQPQPAPEPEDEDEENYEDDEETATVIPITERII